MEEDRPSPLPSFTAPLPDPDPNSVPYENWVAAEDPVREVLNCIYPTLDSEEKRKDVIEYIQKLIRSSVGVEVFPYGSVPLKTYLPDGDIDLTALSTPDMEDSLPRKILAVLQAEELNGNLEFEVKDIRFIDAEVKLVKCLVQNIVIDISFNQLGGLCTLCFIEQVDRLIKKDHVFKRSIILVKTWCYYESRILGAHHGLISTYALETLVLYIFHVFSASLTGPLEVLYRFLDYYSKFDWENYCISLDGPVTKSLLPNIVVENPIRRETNVLLSGAFMRNCTDMFMVPYKGSETRTFTPKFLNIIDPLKQNNNLGRSVHRGNFYRIRSAFSFGAHKLGRILQLPSDKIGDEIKDFFANTLHRHNPKCSLANALRYGTLSTSSFSEANYEDDMHSKFSNVDLDDYLFEMEDVSTVGSTEANDLSVFHALSLQTADEKPDSYSGRHSKALDFVDNKTSHELADGDMNMLSGHDSVLDGLFLDFRMMGATGGIGDIETLNLADLSGDYDSNVRSLLYGQGCHGYALFAAVIRTGPPSSLYGSGEPLEVAIHPWNVSFQQQSSCSQVNPDGVEMGHAPYLTSHNNTSADYTFHREERCTVRGTGPYFPIMDSSTDRPLPKGRGRNRAPALPSRLLQRVRGGYDEMCLTREVNHEGPGPCKWSPPQSRGQSGLPLQTQHQASQVNSQRKLEFGSFGPLPLPQPTSDAEVSPPYVLYGRRQGRIRVESFYLKNEDEFPPLSTLKNENEFPPLSELKNEDEFPPLSTLKNENKFPPLSTLKNEDEFPPLSVSKMGYNQHV